MEKIMTAPKEIKEKICKLRDEILDEGLKFYENYRPAMIEKIRSILKDRIPERFLEDFSINFQFMSEFLKASMISVIIYDHWESIPCESNDKESKRFKEQCLERLKKCEHSCNKIVGMMLGRCAAFLGTQESES